MELVALGAALLAGALLMVLVARPKDGDSAPFLKSWPLGQAYALSVMASAVAGVALILSNWPQ
jgi:hypothetical protein